jgi:hypothetical protein
MKLQELEKSVLELKEYKSLKFSFGSVKEPKSFIENHISFLKGNPKNRRYLPYYNRLLEFYIKNK